MVEKIVDGQVRQCGKWWSCRPLIVNQSVRENSKEKKINSHEKGVMSFFGKDFVIQAGGGIHGHSGGTFSGATAMRQAVDATLQRISLKQYAKTHKELQMALKLWT